jgi:chromatin segregation and condensation protein Rec8/ScpA/Scc1 (kleisin family)
MSFDNIFAGIRRVPTAAVAAAILAEEEKRRRAQVSRAKEAARRLNEARLKEDDRRLREAWKKARRKKISPVRGTTAQAKLAEKLANGEIDMDTFNAAMGALN